MTARSIQVRVSAIGEITVEAKGFQGRGCEAATQAIEEALGKPQTRHRKPEYWQQSSHQQNQQQLGGS